MIQVGKLSDFPKGCYIAQFFGKEYKDAVLLAEKWNADTVSYFEQHKIGKQNTILVSYIRKEIDANIQSISN